MDVLVAAQRVHAVQRLHVQHFVVHHAICQQRQIIDAHVRHQVVVGCVGNRRTGRIVSGKAEAGIQRCRPVENHAHFVQQRVDVIHVRANLLLQQRFEAVQIDALACHAGFIRRFGGIIAGAGEVFCLHPGQLDGLAALERRVKGKQIIVGNCDGHTADQLIKFIDAKQALSIQIHPDDEYALENENEYGKNEMWYVLDAEPGAYLYCGLSRASSKEEIEERIKNNTITEILNKIEVKKGDVVMVKAGTIHAIGAGIFICEIQQNSNCTYRMYDYDRRDKFGNPRELHIAKSLDVVNPVKYEKDNKCNVMLAHNEHYMSKRLVQCKYFEVIKYEIEDEAKIPVDEASFLSVIVIDGEGTIMTDDNDKELKFKAGESFFINAGKRNVVVKGRSTCIITHV